MIVIFGNGYVGNMLKRFYGDEAVLSLSNITDPAAIEQEISKHKATYVINAAGKTGKPNVDWCEDNRPVTTASNVVGPLLLAELCSRNDIPLLHIGSGCIFYGDPPKESGWVETDLADPLSFYSKTKYASDMLLGHYPNVATVRIRMPISGEKSDRNLLCKLLRYNRVVNARNSVSVLEDCIPAMDKIMKTKASGIYHLTNPDPVTHEQIVKVLSKYNPSYKPNILTLEEFESSGLVKAARSNAVLNTSKLNSLGISLPPAIESIERCAKAIWG